MLFNIYEGKPRYSLLDDLLKDPLNDITIGANVNIIVDLKQVYRKMFRNSIEIENTDPEYLKLEVERITSDIIGIVSHYRNYFYKYGKKSKFYFVYSEQECSLLQQLNPDYKKEYYEKYFNSEENKEKIKLLKRCNKALKIMISGYLPNCYYIESSDFDEMAYFKYIIEESSDSDLNIILSNDENTYQLVNIKNTYCLTLAGLDTKAVSKKTLYSILDIKEDLNPGLYKVLLALSGNSRYSISGVGGYGFKRGAKLLKRLIDNGTLQNTEYLIFPLKDGDLTEEQIIKATNNFDVFTCDKIYNENKILIAKKFISYKKLINDDEVNELNAQVFRNYPLDTAKLLRGTMK